MLWLLPVFSMVASVLLFVLGNGVLVIALGVGAGIALDALSGLALLP